MVKDRQHRKASRAAKKAQKRAQRQRPNYPRVSLKSIFYTTRIYRKAVGPKSYFFAFHRIISAVEPSVTAVIAGRAVTDIADAVTTHDLRPFIFTIIIFLSVQVVMMVLRAINSLFSISSSEEVFIYVSEQVASKYIEIPLSVRESQDFADKFERVRDFGSSITSVTSSIAGVASAIVGLISVVIATLTISPIITVVVAIAAIPSSVLSLQLAARQRRNWREFTKDRRIAWAIRNKITNSNSALEIELNGLSKHLVQQMVRASRRSQAQDIADRRQFFWPTFGADVVENLVSYAALVFVAIEIILGRFAIGQFLTVRNLLAQLSSNIITLFTSISNANNNLVNATDFMEFMDTPAQPNGDIKIKDIPKIEFRNVSFTYPRAEQKALDDISFTLNPGDHLAIVGANGAGKTTLIKLLIGAYTPDEGVILINDQPLERIDRESYLAQIGALFQDFSRYEFATLGENVWFGDVERSYNRQAIQEALEQVGLGQLPEKYPKGLNQIMSKDFDRSNSTDLSGGQWQRLGIARAFFRRPGLMILDEPTASVDAQSEYEIFRNILQQQKDRSTIIISHRFSTVRKAETIIVLDHGHKIEEGTHAELIAAKGLYKEMFELQAEGYQ